MDTIKEMYARWAAGDMGSDDQWGDVTAEPRGLAVLTPAEDGIAAITLFADPALVDRFQETGRFEQV